MSTTLLIRFLIWGLSSHIEYLWYLLMFLSVPDLQLKSSTLTLHPVFHSHLLEELGILNFSFSTCQKRLSVNSECHCNDFWVFMPLRESCSYFTFNAFLSPEVVTVSVECRVWKEFMVRVCLHTSERPQLLSFCSTVLCAGNTQMMKAHIRVCECMCLRGIGRMTTQISDTRKHMGQLPSRTSSNQELADTLDEQ